MKHINSEKKYQFFGLEFASNREAAEHFGVSDAFMSAIFRGKKEPTQKMLAEVGYKKVVTRTVTYEAVSAS